MPFFSKVFKSKDASAKKAPEPLTNGRAPQKAPWSDAWIRTRVDPEEVAELLKECTSELKSRALDIPFLLLPFRPSTETSAARTVVRNYFSSAPSREPQRGKTLVNELKMTDAMVLASVIKWCWSRLPGGVVTWETYEMFKVGEKDSNFAHDAFATFIPISVDSDARVQIIRDFFDLLAAVAAHGKANGLSGHKLSRYAGWWAFEHYDTGKGFEAGYSSWARAAGATSHLFFAYLRSMSPESSRGTNGILGLPRSLQQLLDSVDYPPTDSLISNETTRVVMIVDVVSPTPYALLRRAKNFEYRDDDRALQQFASYDDPVQALTDECQRVLRAISSINQSASSKTSTGLLDPSWSRFEDMGFASTIEESEAEDEHNHATLSQHARMASPGLANFPSTKHTEFGRPTTPSWADFLSSGFVDENGNKAPAPVLLPPDKILPPISSTMRGQSSQSHRRNLDTQSRLEPGELASINKVDVDDAFWWVWISSLAGEEPTSRKAVFGRCALIETTLPDGKWMVMEEQVKGAAPDPAPGAYIAEKKGFLGFTTKRGRLTRRRSAIKKSPMSSEPPYQKNGFDVASRATLAPDQHARIQQAAAELSRKNKEQPLAPITNGARRGRTDETASLKTNSVFTLQPLIQAEASPAMQWASHYDKNEMRAKYLGGSFTEKGAGDMLTLPPDGLGIGNGTTLKSSTPKEANLPTPPPKEESVHQSHSAPTTLDPIARPVTPPLVVESAPLPVQPVPNTELEAADEAVHVPLPNGSTANLAPAPVIEPVATKEPVAALAKTVSPPSPDAKRLKKKMSSPPAPIQINSNPEQSPLQKGPPPVQKTSGIRRLFGTKRSKSREPREAPRRPDPESPVETNPAILAARRALEGKPPPPGTVSTSPLPSPGRFNKLRAVKSSTSAVQPVAQPPSARPTTPPGNQSPIPKVVDAPAPVAEEHHAGPPRTRRDEEYDQLSRVDTNEREHADKEFSTFDQGPLVEQPAFVPEDSPQRSGFFNPEERDEAAARPKNQSVYSAVTMATATTDDDAGAALTQQVSPSDRWAQIRKSAAERAARQSSDDMGHRSRTDTRTDDGETSGEETIESRVARIKARVAELTGNMENARR